MSVYTTLTLQEVQAFAAPYGLEVIDLIPIQGGIQNTNYFIVCENAVQYVLTVFEEMDEQGAGWFSGSCTFKSLRQSHS